MPFDRQAEYQAQLQHLIELARLPAWKAYAWRTAKDLDAEDSGLYRGIRSDLTSAMAGLACTTASEAQTPTKRP